MLSMGKFVIGSSGNCVTGSSGVVIGVGAGVGRPGAVPLKIGRPL